MPDTQNLPENLRQFIKSIREYGDQIKSVDVEYLGFDFAETPTESFRIKVSGRYVALMGLTTLPDGLTLHHVHCHSFDNNIVNINLEIKRKRIER